VVPVAITGTGMISAQGVGVGLCWANIVAGRDALGPWVGLAGLPVAHPLRRLKVAACPEPPRPGDVPLRLWRTLSRTQQLACVATDEALAQAGLPRKIPGAMRAALFLATTVCGMDRTELFFAQYRRDREAADVNLMRRLQPYETLALVARRHAPDGVLPPQVCLTTCVGSSLAIAAAADALAQGACEVAIAGGSEALCRVVLSGFNALKVVAAEGCRPFDKDRPGITVGEGAAVVILERVEHARRRGAVPLAYLVGAGISCDAYHLTAPDPQAVFAAGAMEAALREAGLSPGNVDYVNAHGTGTRDNDAAETAALRRVFGAEGVPPVSSTKRCTGHTFGAAGAMEAIVCVQALREGVMPMNAGSVEPDPGLELPVIRGASVRRELRRAMSVNFAFGGNNTALIFARDVEEEWAQHASGHRDCGQKHGTRVTGVGVVTDGCADVRAFAAGVEVAAGWAERLARVQVLGAETVGQYDTITQLVVRAGQQALSLAGLLNGEGKLANGKDTGLIVVSAWGTIDATVAYLESMLEGEGRFASPRHFSRSVHSSVASLAAIHFGVHGPCETLCFPQEPVAAGLMRAQRLLTAGRCRRVLVVFAEQAAEIAVDLARRAVEKLGRGEYRRYVDEPLGFGGVAVVIEVGAGWSVEQWREAAARCGRRWETVFAMDEALRYAEAVLVEA
jgi:3-oxoacyl-(acyl-carrier-protein) synthase